ncbi:MAG: WG repeat-containing protein [Saprospiraceae bacterium]
MLVLLKGQPATNTPFHHLTLNPMILKTLALFNYWKNYALFLFLNCLFLTTSNAQIGKRYLDVHPVRVNHKWGYIKIYPTLVDTIIFPKYDFLGDVNVPYNKITNDGEASPYKVFELNGKVGLLNKELEEVVSNQYHQIKVVSNNFFANAEEGQFELMDIHGKAYFEGAKFQNICLAEGGKIGQTNYFYTKKDGQWGISRIPNDEEIVPAKYSLIEWSGHSGYYKVKASKNGAWGLIDTTGRLHLPLFFEDIIVLDEQNYAVLEAGKWYIHQQVKGEFSKKEEAYAYFKKVNKQLALFVPFSNEETPNAYIWNFRKDTIIHTFRKIDKKSATDNEKNYAYLCNPLDDEYAIKYSRRAYHLMNPNGKKVSTFFRKIEPTQQANIYLVRRGGYGLFNKLVAQDTFISSPTNYSNIFAIQNNLAICTQDGNYGVIGITPDSFATLPCNYTAIPQIDKDSISLQFKQNVFNYVFEKGTFVPKPVIYEETILIPKAVKRTPRAAEPIDFARYTIYEPTLAGYEIQGDSLVTRDTVRGPLGRPIRNSRTGKIRMQYRTLLRLDPTQKVNRPKNTEELLTNFRSIYLGGKTPLLPSYLSAILPGEATTFQMYDYVQNKSIQIPPIIGLRPFDEVSTVSTFIAPDGKMGIVNKAGQELTNNGQAIRYTYIGPFIAGRARACSGGTIIFDLERNLPLPPKFSLGNVFEFLTDFRMPYANKIEEEKVGIKYFLKDLPNNPVKWNYIDTNGKVIIATDFDYVEDFHWQDSSALVLKEIDKEVYKGTGKNDAVYGIINFNGQVKVPPIYSRISIHKDFYLIQKKGTPTFTFNQEGHEIIINATKPRGFSEGRAQLKNPKRLIGYIDEIGTRVIPAQYKLARDFSAGLAFVIDTLNKYQFIDKNGQPIFEVKNKNPLLVSDFKEGYSWIKKAGKSWFWECVNTKGEIAFKRNAHYQLNKGGQTATNYFVPMSFSNGLASVVIVDTVSRKLVSAIIDTTGRVLYQFNEQLAIEAFNQHGSAIFEAKNGKGVVDSLGKIWISPQYKTILPFNTKTWKVQTQKGLWGVINEHGKFTIPPKYIKIGALSEGKVAVKLNEYDGWFYINETDYLLIHGPFRSASSFKNNYATVENNEAAYIINTTGVRIAIEDNEPLFFSEGLFGLAEKSTKYTPERQYFSDDTGANVFGRFFQAITPFQQGIARVKRLEGENKRKEFFGAINKRGVMIVAPKFKNLHIQPDGTVIINPQQYFGLLDKQGKPLIKPQFDKIEQFLEFNVFRVERGESVGYVRIKNGKCYSVWELQK